MSDGTARNGCAAWGVVEGLFCGSLVCGRWQVRVDEGLDAGLKPRTYTGQRPGLLQGPTGLDEDVRVILAARLPRDQKARPAEASGMRESHFAARRGKWRHESRVKRDFSAENAERKRFHIHRPTPFRQSDTGGAEASPLHKTKEGTIQSKANSQEWLFRKEERCKTRG